MKSILVTGGAGFIGSHLCSRLLAKGSRVICVDNLYSGSADNISTLIDDPDFHFYRHDICQTLEITEKVDEIYHLACPASPIFYQKDPIFTLKTCFIGSNNLLELAMDTGARILMASTSEVYGDPLVHPQREDYLGNVDITGIRACYDEGKRCAETLFYDYNRTHKVRIKVVRIFNCYGPNMAVNDGRVVSNFIVQALRGDDVTVYGDGNQTRSFCFVDDLVDGLIKAMASDDHIIGPINLGNPEEMRVVDLAKRSGTLAWTANPLS